MASRVTIEDSIEQSVQDAVVSGLLSRGYPLNGSAGGIEMVDAHALAPREGTIDREYVAIAMGADDGGTPLELGSTIRRYVHLVEVFVVGTTANRARNLAFALRDIIEDADPFPLFDYSQTGTPEIDRLLVDSISVERQLIEDPEPWQQFLYLVTVPIVHDH